MGIKFLTSQMMPWCFYMPGSHCHHSSDDDDGPSATLGAKGTVSSSSSSSASTIRLIMSDGRVRIYRRPVKAAELAAEFPKHLVCRSDAFCIGQKVPALPEDEQLQPGHSYFLLPTQFFQSVLSFVTVAASFARAAEATGGGKATLMKAFDVHKTPSGALQIRVSDEFIEKIRTEKEEGEEADAEEGSSQRSRVCTTAALEKDYRQLVRCRDQLWKPKLETISESRKKRLDTFSSFRRKNKETQQNHKVPAPPPPPPPPPRLPVITTKLVKTKEPFSSFKRRKNKETVQQNDKLPTPPPPPPPPRPPMTTTKLVKTKGKQKLRSGKEC